MAGHSVALIVFMVISIILLIVAMGLAAHASLTAQGKDKCSDCNKYSMISAVIAGLSGGIILVVLIMYIYREDIKKKGIEYLGGRAIPGASVEASLD